MLIYITYKNIDIMFNFYIEREYFSPQRFRVHGEGTEAKPMQNEK